jgi:hypothetical protein
MQRGLYKHVDLDTPAGIIACDIRVPTNAERLSLFADAIKANELDSEHKPTSAEAGLRFQQRIVALCLFARGNAVRQLYTPDELLAEIDRDPGAAVWVDAVAMDCTEAFAGTAAALKDARGKSEATPS